MERPSRVSSSKQKASQVEKDKGKGKLVDKPKKGSKVPRSMNAPLRIDEGGHKKKKAQIVSDSESETESSEEEEQTLVVRKRKIKKTIPYATYHTALKKCKEVQTKWVDVEFLAKLGVLDDVRRILRGMGLEKLLNMNYVCYYKQVLPLIASFELCLNKKAKIPNELGYVTFTIDHRAYKVFVKDLCEAYGFLPRLETRFVAKENQDKKVWKMIGKGNYLPGKTKLKWISNPALQYVHKIIANTIFARAETDRINEDEMALLTNGLQPIFQHHFEREEIDGYRDVNLGVILAKRIVYTKKWALREERNKTALHIGGFLTPLLEVAKVPLSHPSTEPMQKIDFATLKRMNFLEGKDGERVTYTFIGTDLEVHKVLLPNVEITKLNCLENLSFEKGESLGMFGNEPVGPSLLMGGEERDEARSAHMDLPLGSPRYYHSFYKGRALSKPVENAFEGIKKSHKWNKWNTRSIYNIKRSCKKKVKALEEQISGLKSMFETYVFKKKSPPRKDDGEFDFELAMEDARRHSVSHFPSSSTSKTFDPPRASSPPCSISFSYIN